MSFHKFYRTGFILAMTVTSLLMACCSGSREDTFETDPWNTIQATNRHWAFTENMDSLAQFFHNDMVIFFPGEGSLMEGKEDIIDAYRLNAETFETASLEQTDHKVQFYNNGNTAAVSYKFDLCAQNSLGETYEFRGKDMYTLIREDGKWLAVAQHYSFY